MLASGACARKTRDVVLIASDGPHGPEIFTGADQLLFDSIVVVRQGIGAGLILGMASDDGVSLCSGLACAVSRSTTSVPKA
jgi:hypothetical protein